MSRDGMRGTYMQSTQYKCSQEGSAVTEVSFSQTPHLPIFPNKRATSSATLSVASVAGGNVVAFVVVVVVVVAVVVVVFVAVFAPGRSAGVALPLLRAEAGRLDG